MAVLISILFSPQLPAQPKRGTVCIAPNSEKRPTLISPGGEYNPTTLMISIDKRPPIHWPHKTSVKIDDLDLAQRHLVVLTSDGKRIQSFWFKFADYGGPDLCVAFDGYQGVQLHEAKDSPWCQCKS